MTSHQPSVAPQVTVASVHGSRLQRKCACGGRDDRCANCNAQQTDLQRRARPGAVLHAGRVAPGIVHDVLGTPGMPLDPAVRADMEGRFDHDFSRVRVHTDSMAAESARSVNALAYTVGQNVVFGAGQYAPRTNEGRGLIAHELTHSLQQRGSPLPERGALAIGGPGGPSEVEAERAARTVTDGGAFQSTLNAPAAVARQPNGPAPVAPVVRSVEVENQQTAITYPVPSNLGAAGRSHFVTIAGSRPDITVRANLDPAVPANDPAAAGLVLESVPAGQVSPGADALHGTVSVPTARKVVVRATLGASQAETTIWAVFVSGRVTGGPTVQPPTTDATNLTIDTDAHFSGTIHPASIITDADRPALDGPNGVNPPGGTNVCGGALAGGADHRWDMSRQRRLRNLDPAGLVPAVIAVRNAAGGQGCLHNVSAFPAEPEVGNDDAAPTDENNDPYAGGGVITSDDSPTRIYPHSVGADGDTIEQHLQFREFARLEFHRTWWRVSHAVPWRVHYRVIRNAGQWVDNGTDAAADNAGF
jgi:hypothetical protein